MRIKCTACGTSGKDKKNHPCKPCAGRGWLTTFSAKLRYGKQGKASRAIPYDWKV